ncbi:MAG: ketoacyl-ACP synthase III [Candidatus Eisenbacteria sp.]|nr:ketoacyl-ACP synthase III [Candidatus Eisenbacteria bacterium]
MSEQGNRLRAYISGTGSAVPERVLTNSELERIVDTSDEWIMERSGIKTRYIGGSEMATSDLCVKAAARALESARVAPEDVDMLIVGTVTPDQPLPSTGCIIQERMGLKNAFAFDIAAACTAFIYGITIADSFIRTGMCRKILVIGAEMLSRITNWEDRTTCVLFGDGAGAALLEPCEGPRGIVSTFLRSDGSLQDYLYIPAGGSRRPHNAETLRKHMHAIRMSGNSVFKHAVRAMGDAAQRVLDDAGIASSDLDLFIPHQANLRIIKATAARIKVPMDKVYVNLDRYGNTSAASVPIALDEASRTGRLKEGNLVEMVAFGGGFTWGAVLVRW